MAKYVESGAVRVVFSPVLNHSDRSYQSHQAAECAGEQGQFWEFKQVLFENHDQLWWGEIQYTVKVLALEHGLDSDGFNARPGGMRDYYGNFDELEKSASFWSSTAFNIYDAWHRSLDYLKGIGVYRINRSRSYGFSVRCIKDN